MILSIPCSPELMESTCANILLKPKALSGTEIRFLRKNLAVKINVFVPMLGSRDQVTVSMMGKRSPNAIEILF